MSIQDGQKKEIMRDRDFSLVTSKKFWDRDIAIMKRVDETWQFCHTLCGGVGHEPFDTVPSLLSQHWKQIQSQHNLWD